MENRRNWNASAAFLLAVLCLSLRAQEIWVCDDSSSLKNPGCGASYLLICPQAFVEDLRPLAKLREKLGHRVACATVEAILAEFSGPSHVSIRDFLCFAAQNWPLPRLEFAALAADTMLDQGGCGIPAWHLHDYRGFPYETDYPYSLPDLSRAPLFVGRLPARNPEQIRDMVRNALSHENNRSGRLWRRRVSFVAGEGHFGSAADALLESVFRHLIRNFLPPWCETTMTYANPRSPYSWPPARFPEIVARRLNEGSLFFVYVGHGSRISFDHIRAGSEWLPMFSTRDVEGIDIPEGSPIAVSVACHTGGFDGEDSLGELLIRRPRGPIAFVGSSQVSHPYANILLGDALLRCAFAEKAKTAGELLACVRERLSAPPSFSPGRLFLDQGIRCFAGDIPLAEVRRDHLGLYNLLGDPASRIALPDFECEFQAIRKGGKVEVRGISPPGMKEYRVIATLEVPLDRPVSESIEAADSPSSGDAAWENRYFRANRKTLASVEKDVAGDSFELEINSPAALPAPPHIVKLALLGSDAMAVGAKILE